MAALLHHPASIHAYVTEWQHHLVVNNITVIDIQIAGGSGITPMFQVAQEILRNSDDKTQVSLIFANQTEDDIILRKELDEMAAKHDNFQVQTRSSPANGNL